MTEGTSQGLFIVVAIVIFGIFVSLSYTLFGKTLQPQVVGLFNTSIENVNEIMINKNSDKIINLSDAELSENRIKPSDFIYRVTTENSHDENSITFSSKKGKLYAGAVVPIELTEDGTYLFEYDFTLVEGSLTSLGGHSNFKYNRMYINDEYVETYYTGDYKHNYKVGETINVKVVLSNMTGTHPTKELYIQPNRVKFDTDYKVRVSNIALRKVLGDKK